MPRVARKPKERWHHRDLRRALMNAALSAIEKEGVEAVNIRKLALKTGVSPAAPYHHFESREALLVALAVEGFELLCASMAEQAEQAGRSPLERLEGLGRGYVRFAQRHPGHFRVMFLGTVKSSDNEALEREGARAIGMLEQAVLACQDACLAPGGDPRALILTAWSAVHGSAVLWTDGSLQADPSFSADYCERAVAHTLCTLLAAAREVKLEDPSGAARRAVDGSS